MFRCVLLFIFVFSLRLFTGLQNIILIRNIVIPRTQSVCVCLCCFYVFTIDILWWGVIKASSELIVDRYYYLKRRSARVEEIKIFNFIIFKFYIVTYQKENLFLKNITFSWQIKFLNISKGLWLIKQRTLLFRIS